MTNHKLLKTGMTNSSNEICETSIYDEYIERIIQAEKYEIRHWSYIINFKKDDICFYTKIPKAHRFSTDIVGDIVNETNKLMALNEVKCLIELNIIFDAADSCLKVVEYVGYSSKFNAIITKEFKGESLYLKSRRKNNTHFEKYYSNIGNWLKIFHKYSTPSTNNGSKFVDEKEIMEKLLVWLLINDNDTFTRIDKLLLDYLANNRTQIYRSHSYTLNGFELRNFLFDDKGNVCFLDPTKKIPGTRIDDVARFIISIDMIHWGQFQAYTIKDYSNYKEAFLRSYFGDEYKNIDSILAFYLIKWLLIRWKEASELLNEGRVSKYLKPFVKKYYSDYLFKKWIKIYAEMI